MLARSQTIRHPNGVVVDTPLLVPSFSSKGFGFDENGNSETKNIFSVASEFLTDTMLISAYDIYYGHIDPISHMITELAFVDSGGYEIADRHDMSEVYKQPVNPQEWSLAQLHEVLDAWPSHIPAVFISYDSPDIRLPLQDQIKCARELFGPYRDQLVTLLIKPETTKQSYVQVGNIIAAVTDLDSFDVIGFTEPELGNSVLARMVNIAKIRLAMDDAGITTPIHIFGSLDPITSCLYFLSGAEIFDGLTWLRYGFTLGLACYPQNYGARCVDIARTDDFIKAKMIQDNLSYLLELSHEMKKFLLEEDFQKFDHNGDELKRCYDLLRTKIARLS